MLSKVRALISKLRYINRLIIEIEKKEAQIVYQGEQLSQNVDEIQKYLETIRGYFLELNEKGQDAKQEILDKILSLETSCKTMAQYTNIEYLSLKESAQKRYLLVGFYGAVNLGDELMLRKVYDDLGQISNQLYIMMCDNPDLDIFQYPGMNIIHYPKTKYDYNYLASVFDGVIFGGGAIIDDSLHCTEESYKYDLGKIFIELSTSFIEKNKKVFALALSTNDKLTDDLYISKLKNVIEKSEYFSVRDKYSAHLLKRLTGHNVNQSNDIVLMYDLPPVDRIKRDTFRIGIIWICNAELKENLEHLILFLKKIYNKEKLEIRFIPFYNFCDCDIRFYNHICAHDDNSIFSVSKMPRNFSETFEEIYNCDLIISMRYHGALIGLRSGKPTFGILYKNHSHYYNKMTDLFEKFGCSENLFDSLVEMEERLPVSRKIGKNVIIDKNDYREVLEEIIQSLQ